MWLSEKIDVQAVISLNSITIYWIVWKDQKQTKRAWGQSIFVKMIVKNCWKIAPKWLLKLHPIYYSLSDQKTNFSQLTFEFLIIWLWILTRALFGCKILNVHSMQWTWTNWFYTTDLYDGQTGFHSIDFSAEWRLVWNTNYLH